MRFFSGKISNAHGIVKATRKAKGFILKENVSKAKELLDTVLVAFRDLQNLKFKKVEIEEMFAIFEGALDVHDLERVADALKIELTDEVRTRVIAAMSKSRMPNISMEDLLKIASGRKGTGSKLKADEYEAWASRVLVGTYLEPTLDEALELASKIKDADKRALYALHVLERGVAWTREHADGVKSLNAPESMYIDFMAKLIGSHKSGIEDATQFVSVLSLKPEVLGKAVIAVYETKLLLLTPKMEKSAAPMPASATEANEPAEERQVSTATRWRMMPTWLSGKGNTSPAEPIATTEPKATETPNTPEIPEMKAVAA